MSGRRLLIALAALWLALLVPAAMLWGHECHGAIGLLAHSPLYAFQGLSALFAVLGTVALTGMLSRAGTP